VVIAIDNCNQCKKTKHVLIVEAEQLVTIPKKNLKEKLLQGGKDYGDSEQLKNIL